MSIGIVSMIPTIWALQEDMIAAGDQELCQEKAQGRNTYCVYSAV